MDGDALELYGDGRLDGRAPYGLYCTVKRFNGKLCQPDQMTQTQVPGGRITFFLHADRVNPIGSDDSDGIFTVFLSPGMIQNRIEYGVNLA